jgi:hypothetical protein
VDWVVNDAPDSAGTFSGYPTNQLINITVNRVVQSKVSNFLKKNQSLGGTDGYYFHVNSYDWKNTTAPVSVPDGYRGFAVERGITTLSPSSAIIGATNASPIVIALSTPPTIPLVTGQLVTIIGITGNNNANGTWPITIVDTTHFSLNGSVGSGTYTSSTGNAYLPTDMPTLTWDNASDIWRFALNTNGDGTTLGASQTVKVNNFLMDGYLALGPDPADSGSIRLSNNTFINWEANPTGTDIISIGVDALNRIALGSLATDTVYTPGVIVVDGYIQHDGTGNNTASVGFIREKNNTTIIAFRTQSGLLDVAALSSNASNNITLGDAVNAGIFYNTSTGNVHQFQVNSVSSLEIGNTFARFTSGVTLPSILQTTTTAVNATGQTLVVQAQNSTVGTTVGGILSLTSGTGTSAHGTVDISTGGTLKARFFPTTASTASDNNSIQLFENKVRFDTAQATPLIRQDDSNSLATGNSLTLQAQNTSTASSIGGALNLTSGTGTTNAGQVLVQTGGTNQIIVSPLTIAPGGQTPTTGTVIIRGNLEVVGTTTTVDSTVVDIIGRVIHANWADPITSPNVIAPTLNVGYSVHRGNSAGVPRDGAALIWSEGVLNSGADGYWRHVTISGDGIGTDNFTIANSLNAVGSMASMFTASSDPNPVPGALAIIGSFRTSNNIPAVVGRSILPTTTLNLVATNGTATLPLTPITVVDTTQFTTSGTLLIQSSAGPQTVTYTGKTGTSFTGVIGGTGTIITGGAVAQTNNATAFTPAGPLTLPAGTITVTSTVGFPASGTLRVVSHTSNTSTSPVSVQTITYTAGGGAGTTFTGCTGGTGFLFAGDAVSSLPIPGISDLVLLGTDFGNKILHGSPSNNTGHIFNTPSTFFYDFQVNSVTQVQLGQADIDVSGFAETIAIGPTVNNPRLIQTTLPNTGATSGFNLGVFAQAGQQQTGVTANNNGGLLLLASGAQGTGGSGAAGIDGYVELRTGFTSKVRVFPTLALSAGDNNSILYFENLFRVDTAQVTPRFRQDDRTTASGTGETFIIQAQNETGTTSIGGALTLTSGTGTSTHGNVNIQTGSATRVLVTTSFTAFNDTAAAEALRITPVSTGTTQITYAVGVTSAQINQTQTASTPSAPMSIQSQVTTAASGVGGNLTMNAGNATGTTSTGGNAILTSGTGTTVAGNVQLQTGVVDRVVVHPTFTEFRDAAEAYRITPVSAGTTTLQAASTVTALTYRQDDLVTASGTGAVTTLQAQNETGTTSNGGNLNLTSGTGTSANGVVNLQSGGTTVLAISSVTLVTMSGTTFQFATGVVAPTINQAATGGASGQNLTLQSQNAATTGGNLTLTSGTGGTVAGNVNIQTGAVTKVSVNPTFTTFNDTTEAYRITPVSTGATTLQAINTATSVTYKQGDLTTASGTGATTTLQAQNETGTTSIGGALALVAGTGTSTGGAASLTAGSSSVTGGLVTLAGGAGTTTGGNAVVTSGTGATVGNVQLQTGAVDRVVVHSTFTEFRDAAEALRITPVSSGTTQATFAATVTAVSINQTLTAATPSANMTMQSQVTTAASGVGGNLNLIAGNATGATSTGGNAILTSGTGTTVAGNIQLQTGAVDRVIVHPTFTEFRDTSEAYRITPVSAGATTLQAINTATSVTYKQGDLTTASGTGATTTVQAQNETGTTSTGGALNLTSGTGTTINGAVNLQVGGTTTASVVTNKFVYNKGHRRNVTSVTTTYTVLDTDDYIAITTLAAPFTITLPASPTVGDEYTIKDATGNAGASTVTIAGNGNNIDGSASTVLNSAYAAATFTFAGGQWSIT